MSIDETLQTLALELAAEWDPTLDTAAGSDFRTKFLTPLLERIGGSPLDVDIESFLAERIKEEIPESDVDESYSAMRDLVVRAFIPMADPLRREISGIKVSQSLNNYQIMTRDEVDALLGNYFTSLRSGTKAGGTVRMYFSSPRSVIVTPGTQFSTGSGLNFFPTQIQSITSTQMSFQQDGALYYFDVTVEAEATGPDYTINSSEINTVTGIAGVVRVSNPRKFSTAIAEETKEEGVARARNSITVRNLITKRGAAFVIPESFPAVETLQVIRMGDEEMDRDLIVGPVEVSDIPGGFIGTTAPDLSIGQSVHVGGKVDIYVYQPEPDEETLDIQDLTDKGYRLFAGTQGSTAPGPSTDTFSDPSGFFSTRGVAAGDFLLINDDVFEIDTVSDTELTVTTSDIPGGIYGVTYEVVRKVDGFVTVPLYDLVAEVDGEPVIADDGTPVFPIPGDFDKAPYQTGLGYTLKTDNIALENIKLPLLRIKTVEFLDPLTLESSGVEIPMRDLLRASNPTAFENGDGSAAASGTMRLYFRDAVNCYVTRDDTTFTYQSWTYRPVAEEGQASSGTAGVPNTGVNQILVTGDYTGTVAIGDRFEFLSGTAAGEVFTITATAYNGGTGKTTFTVRETLSDFFASPEAQSQTWVAHVGILEANMSQDTTTGLYYFDIDVEAFTAGTGGNRDAESVFEVVGVNSEGWSLRTTYSVLSYSTRELPYFVVSEWVNDTTQLFVTFTAPAIRLTYEYASSLVDIQAFADDDDNRIACSDVLIRHFTPSYVRTSITTDLDETEAKDAVVSYVNGLDPTEDLEVSDVIIELGSDRAGATHVQTPITLVSLAQSRSRTWQVDFSEDSLASLRVQHFVADANFITLTKE